MAKNALAVINAEAHRIQKAHPRMPWAECRQKGTAYYHRHKNSRPAKKRVTKKVSGMPKKKNHHRPVKRRVSSPGVTTRSKTHTDYNRNRVAIRNSKNITVGSVRKLTRQAKEKLLTLIGQETAREFSAKKVRIKKKIRKKVNELKAEYRRLK
jgi:hypothetical protein